MFRVRGASQLRLMVFRGRGVEGLGCVYDVSRMFGNGRALAVPGSTWGMAGSSVFFWRFRV